MTADPSTHHFSIDVEEYFHPTALQSTFPADDWDDLPRRSPEVVDRLLELLETRNTRATFFVLGWLAEREPEMVERIAAAGHEIASHGYEHDLVGRLGPDGFRVSVRRSKEVLEAIADQEVRGYRAPSFSIVPGLEWAWDVLLEEGYTYDASAFPITQHPTYGYPDIDPDPHWIERADGCLAEIPATTAKIFGSTVPASGGAYFRLLPYRLVRTGLRQAGARGAAGMFYIHPWELDEWAPDAPMSRIARLRTFGGRKRTWRRLRRLLDDFSFRSVGETVDEMLAQDRAVSA